MRGVESIQKQISDAGCMGNISLPGHSMLYISLGINYRMILSHDRMGESNERCYDLSARYTEQRVFVKNKVLETSINYDKQAQKERNVIRRR